MATAKREQILQEAEKLAARGKLDAAIREYRRAIEQTPHDTNSLNRLGDLLVRVNRIPEAIDVYQRIAEHFSEDGFFLKAIAIFKKINRLDPQRTETYEKLADLYFKQGLAVEGRQQLLTLADWFIRSKMASEAVRIYRRLGDLEPGNFQARAKLVDLLVQLGDAGAVSAEIDPLGRALLGRGMLDEALKLYHRALELGPASGNFVAPCVDALVAAGRHAQAQELATRALGQSKGGIELLRAAAHAHSEAGDLKLARTMLDELMSVAGERTDVVQLYGDIMLKVGESIEAKEKVLPAVDRLLAAGDRTRAAGLVKRLLQTTPADIEVLERARRVFDRRQDPEMLSTIEAALADAYFRSGRREGALQLYRELARHEPANRLFHERLETLGERALPAPPPLASPPESLPVVALPGAPPPLEEEVEFVDLSVPMDLEAPPALDTSKAPAPDWSELAPEPPAAVDQAPWSAAFAGAPLLHEAVAAAAPAPAPPPLAEPVLEVPLSATSAEELYTEAQVFFKYGLTEKAISHLHRLFALDPAHDGGRQLLATLGGGEMHEFEFPLPSDKPALVGPATTLAIGFPEPEVPRASPQAGRGRVRLEDLEAILGLGEGQPDAVVKPAAGEGPGVEAQLFPVDLGSLAMPVDGGSPLEWGSGEPPAPPALDFSTPVAAAPPGETEDVEVLAEPVELVEVEDFLGGPSEEQLGEVDFYIEQGLLQEAAAQLEKLQTALGPHPDLNSRQALLKARGWEEAAAGGGQEATADELFSEEERFFDLAAELERELADEEMVTKATGSDAAGEVSIEELFREFQKGVAEQLHEEDYDTHFNLGIAYREMGLLDEAIREFQLAAKSPQLAVEATSMIAASYLEQGLPEQALEWYERTLAIPGLAHEVETGLRYELGRAHEACGNLSAALANFAEVLAVNPGFRDVVDRVGRLRQN
ncbi:MAG: tetratricopeptide repeat protein [Acidobacteriota bacterium]